MKQVLISITAACMLVGTASAASYTIEYVIDDGPTMVWTYNDDGNAIDAYGNTTLYTFDEESRVLCGDNVDGARLCVTFETITREVGAQTRFSTPSGVTGTATLTALEP